MHASTSRISLKHTLSTYKYDLTFPTLYYTSLEVFPIQKAYALGVRISIKHR